jgi:putative transposase
MPDYRHHYRAGGGYFFTVVTHHRQTILLNEDIRAALRVSVNEVRETLPFKVEAWVLLPDHLHCVWTLPENDNNYSLRSLLIKRGVSKQCKNYFDAKRQSKSRKSRNESTLWQRRFWEHHIRDDQDFERCINFSGGKSKLSKEQLAQAVERLELNLPLEIGVSRLALVKYPTPVQLLKTWVFEKV